MEFGFVSCKPRERLDFARANGFRHIELDGPIFHDNSRLEISSRDIGLSFHAPLELSLAVKADDLMRANIDFYKRLIDKARESGAEWITFHPGVYLSYFFTKEQALERSVTSLRELVEYAERRQVILAVENFRNSRKDPYPYFQLGTEIGDFERIFSAIDSMYLRMCFDVGHANMTGSPVDYIRAFGGKMHSVHVHDNHGERDEHLVCGKGNVNWQEVIEELEKAGFNGKLVIENEDNPDNILASKNYLAALIR